MNSIARLRRFFARDPEFEAVYWNFARKVGCTVLSINHEFNPHTVRELYKQETGARVSRHPYPMRRGYIEEIISFEARRQ